MPAKAQPKMNAQVGRLFGLAKDPAAKAGMDPHDYLADLAFSSTRERTSSLAELTFDEANAMIKALGGDPFSARGKSLRMVNYRKQAAGIKTVETEAHVKKIRELAAVRNMGDEGLTKLAGRMRLPWPPNTTEQGNKLVEALKDMNKRDNVRQFPKPEAAAEPTFRRVA